MKKSLSLPYALMFAGTVALPGCVKHADNTDTAAVYICEKIFQKGDGSFTNRRPMPPAPSDNTYEQLDAMQAMGAEIANCEKEVIGEVCLGTRSPEQCQSDVRSVLKQNGYCSDPLVFAYSQLPTDTSGATDAERRLDKERIQVLARIQTCRPEILEAVFCENVPNPPKCVEDITAALKEHTHCSSLGR